MSNHAELVPYREPDWVQVLPSRWVAEYDGEAAGTIDLTRRGRYRVTDRHSRRVGTYNSIDQAREHLAASNRVSRREHLDASKGLTALGFVLLIATTVFGVYGLTLVL